jgi:hypothetical protein
MHPCRGAVRKPRVSNAVLAADRVSHLHRTPHRRRGRTCQKSTGYVRDWAGCTKIGKLPFVHPFCFVPPFRTGWGISLEGLSKTLDKRTVSRAARKGLDLLSRHECGACHGHEDSRPCIFQPDFSICASAEGKAGGRTYSSIGTATRRRSLEAHDARSAWCQPP